jgi:hypothetical protein
MEVSGRLYATAALFFGQNPRYEVSERLGEPKRSGFMGKFVDVIRETS